MIVGNRIPHEFFLTTGHGESDVTIHAGSYHLALRDAGIEQCNIITYSSILPGSAKQLRSRPPRESFVHGEVLETIMASASCTYGETATAGLIWGWLHDPLTGERYGGLVCEYNGSLAGSSAEEHLREMLAELYSNGYEHFELRDTELVIESVTPIKMYGTALVALCFVSYDVPLREV